jgi:hypothetical protein
VQLAGAPNGRSVHIAASAKLTDDLLGGVVYYLGGYEWFRSLRST